MLLLSQPLVRGGRVLDRFRSSLTPKLVECLICGQDWFRASPIPIQVEENKVDMEDIERGNIYYTMCFTYCLWFTPLFNSSLTIFSALNDMNLAVE